MRIMEGARACKTGKTAAKGIDANGNSNETVDRRDFYSPRNRPVFSPSGEELQFSIDGNFNIGAIW